jgi:hypothetical protein
MSPGGRGPFWSRRAPGNRRGRPLWARQRPRGRDGPWWLRPGRPGPLGSGGTGARGSLGALRTGMRGRGRAGRGWSAGSGRVGQAAPASGVRGGGGLDAGRGQPGGGTPGARGAAASALRPAGGTLGWIGARAAAALAVVLVLAGAAGFVLQRADSGPVAGWARSTGHDAVWLGHAWLDGRRGPSALPLLAARIRGSGIGDVYVFSGTLDRSGRLPPGAFARAGAFLAAFHAACPNVRVSAWLGGVTGPGHADLADGATRGHIVAAAAAALHAGFTGVHYDLEPVTNGDLGLLTLLTATRQLRPHPLSVAVPKLEPLPGLRLPAQLALRRPVFWTPGYLTQVASRVDQVAVMSYGTGMPFPSWFGGYVERETALALRAVPRQTALVMGLPAYHGSNLGHHPGAETVAAAIHGIRVAVTEAGRGRDGGKGGAGEGYVGVALFADYSATSQDWASYLHEWVRPPA